MYSRSELRETVRNPNLVLLANWDLAIGLHSLQVTYKIGDLPPVDPDVYICQIHNGFNKVIAVRVNGKVISLVGDDLPVKFSLRILEPLLIKGSVFNIKIEVRDGILTVFYNGSPMIVHQFSPEALALKSNFFKVGSYIQSSLFNEITGHGKDLFLTKAVMKVKSVDVIHSPPLI
jgi:hypothetical protein